MASHNLSCSDLQPGSLTSDVFAPLGISGLDAPSLDPAQPERFNRPNYDRTRFWTAIWAAVHDQGIEPEVVKVYSGGSRYPNEPIRLVAFSGGDTITPFVVTDQSANVRDWVAAITARMGDGPVELTKQATQSSAGVMPSWELMLADPAAWLMKIAPSSWEARAALPAKQAALAEAAKVAGAPADSDHRQIEPLWNELVALVGIEPSPGATEEQLAEFATTTGFELPDGLKTLLRLSNGAPEGFGFRSLMSVEQITREWVNWNSIFEDFSLDDLQSGYRSDDDRTLPFYTTPRWVSFVDERTGNFAAVDLLPGPTGRTGQIIYFGADEYTIRWLAADVADFLRREIAWAQAGADVDATWF
jgi:cell wall assembly regulator SMI1